LGAMRDDLDAAWLEVGARLHRLRVFGQDLLRTPRDPARHGREPFSWGAYVMAPWCNRIAATPTPVGNREVRIESNTTDGSAIHGQVYAVPWTVRADGSLAVRGGGDGWPWPYEATLRVVVGGASLRIEQSLTNLGDVMMPAGIGLHPWFRRPMEVRIDAAAVLPSNVDPASEIEPVGGPFDLRALGAMQDDLDAAWLEVGDPAAELSWPTLGIRALVRTRSNAGVCIVAASPSGRDAIALEPQTHAPQGLRRYLAGAPGGLHPLAAGRTMRLAIEMGFYRS
ncbi:MAG: putative aldose 1-epimerase (aldose mutarotase), partial [Chloroflexi bacterium]|nr:putative aldose 1-epimerase (aldose mutarotase) [Chloroflexota bacterium]